MAGQSDVPSGRPSPDEGARAARARRAAREARTATGSDPRAALAAWEEVRRVLRARPRPPGLAALHLDAHALPFPLASEAPLSPNRAERIYEDGTALARELGRPPDVARIEAALGAYQLLHGLPRAAGIHAGRARDLHDRWGEPIAAAPAAASEAIAALWCGAASADGLAARRRALASDERPDTALARAALLRAEAWCALAGAGGPVAAEAAWDGTVAAADATPLAARVRAEAAHVRWLAGDGEAALARAEAACRVPPRPDPFAAHAAALGVLALALLECGRAEAARDAALAAERRCAAASLWEDEWLPVRAIAAGALAAAGDRGAARERLTPRRDAPRGHATVTPVLACHEARALLRLGDREGARRRLARAADLPLASAWRVPLDRLHAALASPA